jgi:hypothetical protein
VRYIAFYLFLLSTTMTTTKKTVDRSWPCIYCTFDNEHNHAICQVCKQFRPKKRSGLSTTLIPTKKVAKVSLESTLEGKDPEALQHVLEAESEHADNETAIITEIRTLASELRTTKKRSDKRAKVSLESNLDLGNDLSRKPTLEEKMLMERKSTDGDKKRGFESSANSGFDDCGKMKAMSSSKTVRLLQEDLLKEMSRGDGEGGRTEFIMDILQRIGIGICSA